MSATIISVGGATPKFVSFADFFDGETAARHRVEIEIRQVDDGEALMIKPPERADISWPLDKVRRRPDQAADDVLVLSLAGNDQARLYVTDDEARFVLGARCRKLSRRDPARKRGRLLAWALGAVISVAAIIFVLVPILANQLAELLPPAGEKALGDATFEQIRTALADNELVPLAQCSAPAGQRAIDSVVTRLTRGIDLPYQVSATVLDHSMVNAFALPGGRVVMFRGLIDAAESPDEVAAVMAHEIGHVVNRDPVRGALRSAGSIGVLGLLLGDFAGGTVVLFLINRLIDASYSQEAEASADSFAHQTLADSGIHPSALATMFERLLKKDGDADGIAAHFQAHPKLGDRIAAARAADLVLAANSPPVLDESEWQALQNICR